jgi:hypothetical protein
MLSCLLFLSMHVLFIVNFFKNKIYIFMTECRRYISMKKKCKCWFYNTVFGKANSLTECLILYLSKSLHANIRWKDSIYHMLPWLWSPGPQSASLTVVYSIRPTSQNLYNHTQPYNGSNQSFFMIICLVKNIIQYDRTGIYKNFNKYGWILEDQIHTVCLIIKIITQHIRACTIVLVVLLHTGGGGVVSGL